MKELVINGKITEYNSPFIIQIADPYVYKHTDNQYYFTATVPEYDKIVLRNADTLLGLKDSKEVIIWESHKTGPMSNHI